MRRALVVAAVAAAVVPLAAHALVPGAVTAAAAVAASPAFWGGFCGNVTGALVLVQLHERRCPNRKE